MAITVTRDPNYRDPNFDRDFSAAEGTVEALDMFNAPPAGHSLTDTPQEWSWERPAQISKPEDAVRFVVERLENKETEEEFGKLMMAGVPIEAIVNTISLAGFTEGMWTPDIAELIKMPIALHLVGFAMENNIPATMFNVDPEKAKQDRQMPEEDIIRMMAERSPDMLETIQLAAEGVAEGLPFSKEEEELPHISMGEDIPPEQSFLSAEEEV